MAQIDFTISKGGAVKIEPTGYGGGLCHDVTKLYEQAVGGKVLEQRDTAEAGQEPLREKVTVEQHIAS